MNTADRLEDWPPALRETLAAGLRQRLVTRSGHAWEFEESTLDPLHPGNGELYRALKLGREEAVMLVLRSPRYPKHVFQIIGLRPPAEGMGIVEYQPVGSDTVRELIARGAYAYTRGSKVIGELEWTEGDRGIDRVVNGLEARRGRERQEVMDALAGLQVMANITKPKGRPPTPQESKIDRLARDGLKWLKANEYSVVEDVGRPQISEARGRSLKAINEHMGRSPVVVNEDVHRRMHELLDAENSSR